MRKGHDEWTLIIMFLLPIIIITLSGGLNGFTSRLTNSTNCQSYITQIDSLQSQVNQLNQDVSNAKSNESGGNPLFVMLGGFIIGAVTVIGYFWWHEQKEKKQKDFQERYLKARRK
jgi:outer membrane murein-binding lipoprotein Lpp